jgi:hypothetical protein
VVEIIAHSERDQAMFRYVYSGIQGRAVQIVQIQLFPLT